MKPSILFVSTSANWPITDGKRQRTYFLLEALKEKYEVDYLFIGNQQEYQKIVESKQDLQNIFLLEMNNYPLMGLSKVSYFNTKIQHLHIEAFTKKANAFIEKLQLHKTYKFLFFRYIDSLIPFTWQSSLPIVADVDDVFDEKQISLINTEKQIFRKCKRWVYKTYFSQYYREAYKRCALTFITKIQDRKWAGLNKAAVLQNLPFGVLVEKYTLLPLASNQSIGFIGKLSYLPNEQGLIEFLENVWPDLLGRNPGLQFYIAGSGNPSEKLMGAFNQAKNVKHLGFVQDATQFWEQVSIGIVPVFSGGGTNIKIAESLYWGRPVVATKFSAKGYENEITQEIIFIANSKNEWISNIEKLISNSSWYQEKANFAKTYSKEKFSFQQWSADLHDAIQKKLSN